MKSSYSNGNPTVNRVCLRTKDDRTSDRDQIASTEPPTEVQGPRYPLSHERKDGGAPATRNTELLLLGRCGRQPALYPAGAPQPRLTLSPVLLPADGTDRTFGSIAGLICSFPGSSEPLFFAKAGCACWQSEQWCQDALQKARSCSLGTREQRRLLAIRSPE